MGNSWATHGQAPTTRSSGQRESAARWSRTWSGRRDSKTRDPHLGKLAKGTFLICTKASDSARDQGLRPLITAPCYPDDFHSLTGEGRETKQADVSQGELLSRLI